MAHIGSCPGTSTLEMVDVPLEVLLGRMDQKIEDIKADIQELKEEQDALVEYVRTQRIGFKLILGFVTSIGALFVYYKDHIETFIFGKVTH